MAIPKLNWEEVDDTLYQKEEYTFYRNYKITIFENDANTWGFYLDDDESDGEESGYIEREFVIEEAVAEIDSRIS